MIQSSRSRRWLAVALFAVTGGFSTQATAQFDYARAVVTFAGMSKQEVDRRLQQSVNDVAAVARIYGTCSLEAEELATRRPPDGFSALDPMVRAQLVRPNDPLLKDLPRPAVRPEYVSHANFVSTRRNALGECGNRLAPFMQRLPQDLQFLHDALALLKESQMNEAAPIVNWLQQLDQNAERFSQSLNRLSNNPEAAGYVGDVIMHLSRTLRQPAHARR
jgi:hypothetical protein